jgi:hypothetical protein
MPLANLVSAKPVRVPLHDQAARLLPGGHGLSAVVQGRSDESSRRLRHIEPCAQVEGAPACSDNVDMRMSPYCWRTTPCSAFT